MNKKQLLAISSIIMLVVAIGTVAFVVPSVTNIQISKFQSTDNNQATSNTLQQDGRKDFGPHKEGRFPGYEADLDKYLAEALSISVDELNAARQSAADKALILAVEQGLITQEQADAIKAKGSNMPWKGFLGKGNHSVVSSVDFDALLADELNITVEELQIARQSAFEAATQAAIDSGYLTEEQAALMQAQNAIQGYISQEALLSNALGITIEDIQTAQQEGKSVSDLLNELGLSPEEFQQSIQLAYQEAVQKAVNAGVITQEQADLLLNSEMRLGHFGPGSQFFGPRGHSPHSCREGFERSPQAPNNTIPGGDD